MTRTLAPCVASCARVEILIKSIGFARLTPKNEKLVKKILGCNEYLHLCGGRGLGEILYI